MPKRVHTYLHPKGSCWHCTEMAMEHTVHGPVLVRDLTPAEIEEKLRHKAEEFMAEEQMALRQRLLTMASRPEDWLIICPRCSDPLMLQEDGTERCVCGWKTDEPMVAPTPVQQRRWGVRAGRTVMQVTLAVLILSIIGTIAWWDSVQYIGLVSVVAVLMSFFAQAGAQLAEQDALEKKIFAQQIEVAESIRSIEEGTKAIKHSEQELLTAIGRTKTYPPPGFEGAETTPTVAEKLFMNKMISEETYREILNRHAVPTVWLGQFCLLLVSAVVGGLLFWNTHLIADTQDQADLVREAQMRNRQYVQQIMETARGE